MNVNSTIAALLNQASTDKNTLDALIRQVQNMILVSDDDSAYPAPELNPGGTWTIRQTTANGAGIYEGVYRLPTPTNCTRWDLVNIVAYQNPSTGSPASLQACASIIDSNPVFVDQPTLQALDGECGSAFIIRSAIPFEVEVALSDCIPVAFEWESSASNTLEGCTAKPRVILRIDGGGVLPNDVEVDITVVGGTATGGGTDYNLLTTSVLFPSGSPDGTTKTVDVQIISDAFTEDNETIILGIDPDEGDLGDVTTHTLTILPGGCSKTWSKTFMFNIANGLQGWTLNVGNLTNSGIQTTNTFLFNAQITLPGFTVPHSSVLTRVTYVPCYTLAANRSATVNVFGNSRTHSNAVGHPNPFGPNCNANVGFTSLTDTNVSGDIILSMTDNQAPNNGYINTVVFSGTGIDPFTGV